MPDDPGESPSKGDEAPLPSSSKKRTPKPKKKTPKSNKTPSSKKKPPPSTNPKKKSPLQRKPSALKKQQAKVDAYFAQIEGVIDTAAKNEKEMVPLLDTVHPYFLSFPNHSKWWDFAVHIDWALLENNIIGVEHNYYEFAGMRKIINQLKAFVKVGENPVPLDAPPAKHAELSKERFGEVCRKCIICPICFRDDKKTLSESVVLCGSLRPSNISQHCDKKHKEFDIDADQERKVSTYKQSTMSHCRKDHTTKSATQSKFQMLIYRFVNDCCLPAITVEKPQFCKMIQFAMENAGLLKGSRVEIMSRRQITKIRISSYQNFFLVVASLVRKARAEYNRLCSQDVPFVTCCHDIWQARDHDVLGVTIMFTDPRNCTIYRIPIGLAECHGHAATDVANLTDHLLLSVGLTSKDLCAAVNDNTSAAVLAGKYIIGNPDKAGKCNMHKAELILKHATGLVERYNNHILMDSNKLFCDCWMIFKKFASWLTAKKAPHR